MTVVSSTLVSVTEDVDNLSADDLATAVNTIVSVLDISSGSISPQVRLLLAHYSTVSRTGV